MEWKQVGALSQSALAFIQKSGLCALTKTKVRHSLARSLFNAEEKGAPIGRRVQRCGIAAHLFLVADWLSLHFGRPCSVSDWRCPTNSSQTFCGREALVHTVPCSHTQCSILAT